MGHLQGRRAAVIGAGIGGLTAALALARRGADVTLDERAPELGDVGAGIQISANAVRVLDALGVGQALREAAVRNRAVQLNDAAARRVLRMDLVSHRPDADFLLIHRPRLIRVLSDAARAAGVTIRLGRTVDALPDAALVVGADGIHGHSREWLNGREVPFFTGQTAWRAVIAGDGPPEAHVFMGPGRHLVSYPLGRGLRNIVAVQERRDWQNEGWSQPGDPDELRAAFAEFGNPVRGWLAAVDQVNLWGLFRHPVAPVWTDGTLAILGDAAHPTLPFLAQGAGMAIEDAWVLASCLDAQPQDQALNAYAQARIPRVTRIVEAANANARNYHLRGAMRLAGHSVLRIADRIAPRVMPGRFDWLYDHDPIAAHP
ncbi:FAD-dependent monooxygenase [Paracoccus zeaxanthinifaciens]|uniref:FAD-dependent monooxygenase n=1 Tax=Paracoccus zeaxanthinifaciens TaxID=187400 RepID=UPI0003B314ED|nr:FAD-dependent monooxygenase [Paracoccus zeaxanthinifaciens]